MEGAQGSANEGLGGTGNITLAGIPTTTPTGGSIIAEGGSTVAQGGSTDGVTTMEPSVRTIITEPGTTAGGGQSSNSEATAGATCDATKTRSQFQECTSLSQGCCDASAGLSCYSKDSTYAQCLPTGTCTDPTWACTEFTGYDTVCALNPGATKSLFTTCTNDPTGCASCSSSGQQMACYKKDDFFSQCLIVGTCPSSDWGAGSHDCSGTFNNDTAISAPA